MVFGLGVLSEILVKFLGVLNLCFSPLQPSHSTKRPIIGGATAPAAPPITTSLIIYIIKIKNEYFLEILEIFFFIFGSKIDKRACTFIRDTRVRQKSLLFSIFSQFLLVK